MAKDLRKKLEVKWSKKEQDLIFKYEDTPANSHLCYSAFCGQQSIFDYKSFVQQLTDRGYDITTLKFSIRKKP